MRRQASCSESNGRYLRSRMASQHRSPSLITAWSSQAGLRRFESRRSLATGETRIANPRGKGLKLTMESLLERSTQSTLFHKVRRPDLSLLHFELDRLLVLARRERSLEENRSQGLDVALERSGERRNG